MSRAWTCGREVLVLGFLLLFVSIYGLLPLAKGFRRASGRKTFAGLHIEGRQVQCLRDLYCEFYAFASTIDMKSDGIDRLVVTEPYLHPEIVGGVVPKNDRAGGLKLHPRNNPLDALDPLVPISQAL